MNYISFGNNHLWLLIVHTFNFLFSSRGFLRHRGFERNNLLILEGEEKKSLQDILLSTAKVINLRVKSQARGQNNRSIALKWGIAHLCTSNGFGALDLLFWVQAWVLTLGLIIFAV